MAFAKGLSNLRAEHLAEARVTTAGGGGIEQLLTVKDALQAMTGASATAIVVIVDMKGLHIWRPLDRLSSFRLQTWPTRNILQHPSVVEIDGWFR